LVHFNVTTRRYIPEDSKLHTRRRENLKSHKTMSFTPWYSWRRSLTRHIWNLRVSINACTACFACLELHLHLTLESSTWRKHYSRLPRWPWSSS